LYRKAAEQGLAEAQVGLAGCYARGLGVEKDFAEACKWLALSQSGGSPVSTNVLKVLIRMMTPEQITEGQRRAQLFLHPTAAPGSEKTEQNGSSQ
jgi:TPR repeat protein